MGEPLSEARRCHVVALWPSVEERRINKRCPVGCHSSEIGDIGRIVIGHQAALLSIRRGWEQRGVSFTDQRHRTVVIRPHTLDVVRPFPGELRRQARRAELARKPYNKNLAFLYLSHPTLLQPPA